MSKNPTIEQFQAAYQMRLDGKPWKEVQEACDLNYSQAWLYCTTQELKDSGYTFLEADEVTEAKVQELREAQLSWGRIAVLCQKATGGKPNESRIRKMFEKSSGLRSEGLRIGKGGRFKYGISGEPLYTGELRPTGTPIPVGEGLETAITVAESIRLTHLEISELRARCEEKGLPTKGTKAQLARRLITAS